MSMLNSWRTQKEASAQKVFWEGTGDLGYQSVGIPLCQFLDWEKRFSFNCRGFPQVLEAQNMTFNNWEVKERFRFPALQCCPAKEV